MLENELVGIGTLFLFAIIGAIIATKLKQPPVIGLLLVGVLIGPNFLNLVRDRPMIEMVGDIGGILLMFVIGLEFVIPKLAKIGFKALMFGVLKIGIIFFIVFEILVALKVPPQAALVFGVMLSISSTVVIVKILESKCLYDRQEMPLLIGVLIMEDIFAVIVLTFLSGTKSNSGMIHVFESLIIALTILVISYIIMLKITRVLIPMLLKSSGDEVVTFLALGICAGFSYMANCLGLSPATGAFLAGSVVASLNEVHLFEHAIKPYTLTFTSLFFISIGTMVDLRAILDNYYMIIILIILTIATRFIAVGGVSYLFANFKRQQTIFSSIAMISVGEFSLLIGKEAANLNLGIDFVSIAAFVIFITAIIMSCSISYYEKVTDILVTAPHSYTHKTRSFSNFMKALTEEIDTENTNSMRFKNQLFNVLANILFLLFTYIAWNKGLALVAGGYIRIGIHAASALLVLYFIYKIISGSRDMFSFLSIIISNLYFFGNVQKSRRLLSDMLIAFFLLLLTIFSPVLLVLFRLPAYLNFILLIPLFVIIFKFLKVFTIVHHGQRNVFVPKYKKFSDVYGHPKV